MGSQHLVGWDGQKQTNRDRHAGEGAEERQQQQEHAEGAIPQAPEEPLQCDVLGGGPQEQVPQNDRGGLARWWTGLQGWLSLRRWGERFTNA
jgi:hypothetical protein